MPSKAKKVTSQQPSGKAPPQTNATDSTQKLPNSSSTKQVPSVVQNNVLSPPIQQSSHTKSDQGSRTGDTTESVGEHAAIPTGVNRKKQKRREREAAKKAAGQEDVNGHLPQPNTVNGQIPIVKQPRGPAKGYFTEEPDDIQPSDAQYDDAGSPDDAFYSGDEDQNYGHDLVHPPSTSWLNTSKRKKSIKSKSSPHLPAAALRQGSALPRSHLPTLSNAALRSAHRMSNDQIWNTSTQAERENIKQFWLELGEDERRSLVKVEKEAVLRKMKEQQKHSCSCSVCGRKRTAIEEELEVLYDAYYEELEQFAHHNNGLSNAPQIMAPPRPSFRRIAHPMAGSYPSRGRVHEIGEDEEDLEDDEDYADDEEPYSDEDDDLDDHQLPPGPTNFLQFGNSLTVKDGILTVADDLLKNDGRHFIDMMEQLAERRMQREEEVHYPSSALAHQDLHQGHNHPPLEDEDDDYEDDDDDDYDSQEEEDFENDEMVGNSEFQSNLKIDDFQDSMTEEQRMEEGRRMFQIFAARMFEQRVLTAYREKVAAERQRKLLEELDEETRLDTAREAKKAREAAKKKEKKKLQKQAKEEEKAKKDAEKAAQEAAIKEAEAKKQEEQRQRKEEQRKKREQERKAAEDERIRKEAEKQKRAQEEKDRQAEADRKARDAKERERKKKEDVRKKEREEREAKEKEVRERKAKEEKERKAKEDQLRKEKDGQAKSDKETRDRSGHVQGQNHGPRHQPVAIPPGLHPINRNPSVQSPHFQVATPIVSATAPIQARTHQSSLSGPQSNNSSPHSQKANADLPQASISPAAAVQAQVTVPIQPPKSQVTQPTLHHSQPSAPKTPLNNSGRGQYAFNVNGVPNLGVSGPPPGGPGMLTGMGPSMPMFQPPPGMMQPRFVPGTIQYPPGFSGPRHFMPPQQLPPHGQLPGGAAVPQHSAPVGLPMQPSAQAPGHNRQPSMPLTTESTQPAPIARPGPIARPSSTTPDRSRSKDDGDSTEVDQITTQLGSKALLEDSDDPILAAVDSRTNLPPVGAPGSNRLPFASSFPEPKSEGYGLGNPGWSSFTPAMHGNNTWGAPGSQRPNSGWSQPQPFGSIGSVPPPLPRSHLPRPIAVRQMLVQACRQLSNIPGTSHDGFHPVQNVLRHLELLKAPGEAPVSIDELLGICDTEGNAQNGGGTFEVHADPGRGEVVRFVEDAGMQSRGNAGDIGSPLAGNNPQSMFGGIGSAFGPPGRTV